MDIFIKIGVPIIAAIVGAVASWFLATPKEYVFTTRQAKQDKLYDQLSRTWQEYHLSHDKTLSTSPIWMHEEMKLKVFNKVRVKGSFRNLNHPRKFTHTFKGEITSDILVIIYSSKEVKGDVGVSMYSNILAGEYLLGFVIGTDYDKNALSSVSILSKSVLDEDHGPGTILRRRPLSRKRLRTPIPEGHPLLHTHKTKRPSLHTKYTTKDDPRKPNKGNSSNRRLPHPTH